MARPVKDVKADAHFQGRCTTAQKQAMEKLASEARMEFTAFILFKILGAKPKKKLPTPQRQALMTGLANMATLTDTLSKITPDSLDQEDLLNDSLQGVKVLTSYLIRELKNGNKGPTT